MLASLAPPEQPVGQPHDSIRKVQAKLMAFGLRVSDMLCVCVMIWSDGGILCV